MRVLFHTNVNAISEGNAMSQNFEREDKKCIEGIAGQIFFGSEQTLAA